MLFRLSVQGIEHVPATGFVLCSNPLLGPLVRGLGAVPPRGGDHAQGAVATAARLAQEDHPVVIFPTGARRRSDRVHRPRTGAARAAILGGVPLIPAAVRGTDGWKRLRRWQVAFDPAVRSRQPPGSRSTRGDRAPMECDRRARGRLDQGALSGATGPRTASGSS